MLNQLSQYFAKKKGEKIEMTKRSLWFNGFEVEHKTRLIKICIERCENSLYSQRCTLYYCKVTRLLLRFRFV